MNKKKRVLCIIPARGGSKGLKLKNLQKVCGKPLIYYPIIAAIKSKVCDEIFVSTDSKKIAKIATGLGASVPFLRNKKFSKDLTTTEATLKNALIEYEKFSGTKFDYCVFLTCTNIFRNSEWIKRGVKILKKNPKVDSVFSVHHLYKHFWHYDKKKKRFKKILPWMSKYTSRQVAPVLYREDTGNTLITKSKFWREGKRIGKICNFIVNTDPFTGIDIHSKKDLLMAEFAMQYAIKNKLYDFI